MTLCELLLLLQCKLIDLLIIKVLEVLLLYLSQLLILLEEEVVGGGDVVVLVGVDALHSVVLFEVVLDEEFEDLYVDGDLGEPDKDASSDLL